MPQKWSDILNWSRRWEMSYQIHFCFVYLNPFLGDYMTQNNALLDHKVAFLPIQSQILFSASSENQIEIVKAILRRNLQRWKNCPWTPRGIFPPCQKKYWAYIVGMLQVHCTTQRACICTQIFQTDMWTWFSPDPRGLPESDFSQSIHQENNNTHVRLNVRTSG